MTIAPNVLISCAGRRNYLLKYFSAALAGTGEVFATDASADAVALAEADQSFLVPYANTPGYVDTVLDICARNQVGLLISVNDYELPIFAVHRDRFSAIGTTAVIAGPETITTCFDKVRTATALTAAGLLVPRTILSLAEAEEALARSTLSFPVVVKPRWGSGSLGLQIVWDFEELRLAHALLTKLLARSFFEKTLPEEEQDRIVIQEYLDGVEYGLDVVNDLNGVHVVTFVKRKLAMRAGETDKAVTMDLPALEQLGATLGNLLKHVGVLDCDVFVTDRGTYVLDLNPRFGGGYPFSHLAGANIPAALLAWRRSSEVAPEWLRVRTGVRGAKCDRMVELLNLDLLRK